MAKNTRKSSGRPQLTEAEKLARKEALKSEPKDAKFTRLALPRVNKAINAIRQIGNLSGPSYAFTPEQVTKISKTLSTEIDAALEKFAKGPTAEKKSFSFE